MSNPKWKRFERLVHEIQRELAPQAEVRLNDLMSGLDSKTARQIDISIRQPVGQFPLLIVLECKDHQTPVDVKDIGEFASLVTDVRAHKGAIVSSSGFTPAAIEFGRTRGIDTFRLVDTQDKDWKAYVSIPALLQRSFIAKYKVRLQNFGFPPKEITTTNWPLLRVFSPTGEALGTMRDVLARKWNNGEIAHEPGEREVLIGENLSLEVGDSRVRATVFFLAIVAEEFFFGHVPISTKGFWDEQAGALITREFTTDILEPSAIEQGLVKGWQRVSDPSQLAVQPFFKLAYSDVMPTTNILGSEALQGNTSGMGRMVDHNMTTAYQWARELGPCPALPPSLEDAATRAALVNDVDAHLVMGEILSDLEASAKQTRQLVVAELCRKYMPGLSEDRDRINLALRLWAGCLAAAKTIAFATRSGENTAANRAELFKDIDALAAADTIFLAGVESAPAFKRLRQEGYSLEGVPENSPVRKHA